MLVKMARTHAPELYAGERWDYFDGITRVTTFGFALPSDSKLEGGGHRISVTTAELRQWVNEGWGSPDQREFADEVWPEFADEEQQLTVRCVRAERKDGTWLLLLLSDEAYLLSDEGRTVDRL